MKVLLVYPVFPDTYWSFRHALQFEGKRSAFPPLGLLTVSSMLPESWERKLIDMNVETLEDADIMWADMVFLSAMIVQKESLESVTARCRKLGKRVVVGGPYVSTGEVETVDADHIFSGEAEETLPAFLEDLENGTPAKLYKPENRPSLENIAVPDFSLLDPGKYSAMSLQYSRGCPFNCEFCDIIEIYGRVPRTKTNDQMIAELDALWETGWRGLVFIVDDNFIGNKRNVRLLVKDLAKWSKRKNYPFSFITEASVNLAKDESLMADMQDAGFERVFLGIETPVEESLKAAQKGQNTKQDLLESVLKIQSYGMEVMAGFILGFDSDPEDIFDRQIDFIQESGIPLAMVGLLTALPDTQLWRRLKREGRLLEESTGNNTDCSLNFVPEMDATKLIEGYKQVLLNIYSPRQYYRRALDCLAQYRRGRLGWGRNSLRKDIAALLRILVTLGVRDRGRFRFWSYLIKVVLFHRKNLAHGLTLAAMGYHFRVITAATCK